MLWIKIAASLITALGDILIGLSVIQVHLKLSQEKKVDKEVIREVKEEKHLVVVGILLILLGLTLDVYYHYNYGISQ